MRRSASRALSRSALEMVMEPSSLMSICVPVS
jgi:hypothetical protein